MVKENFCALCALPIIAAAGGATSASGAILTEDEKNKKKRKILIWTGISVVFSAVILYLWLRWRGSCKTCKLP